MTPSPGRSVVRVDNFLQVVCIMLQSILIQTVVVLYSRYSRLLTPHPSPHPTMYNMMANVLASLPKVSSKVGGVWEAWPRQRAIKLDYLT